MTPLLKNKEEIGGWITNPNPVAINYRYRGPIKPGLGNMSGLGRQGLRFIGKEW